MELTQFLTQFQADIQELINERLNNQTVDYPYPELVFTEMVMDHLATCGLTMDAPAVCHYEGSIGNAKIRLSGYTLSESDLQLDLFVSIYSCTKELTKITDQETQNAARQCYRFLSRSANGSLIKAIDPSNEAYLLAKLIQAKYKELDRIRIYVLTDRQAKTKAFKVKDVSDKKVKLEVIDIERLFNHLAEGRVRDEVIANFPEIIGSPLPCVTVSTGSDLYSCLLTAFPGDILYHLYDKYGDRLLEANVRSFLGTAGRVNSGIRTTVQSEPEFFMAYNNGLVIVADEAVTEQNDNSQSNLISLKGIQIVNGGQTTASLYFVKRKTTETDLSSVRVPAKIIVLDRQDSDTEEDIVSNISKYANSQTAVRQADLSSNKPFHQAVERLANTTYCPDGQTLWYYERATGSYQVLLTRKGVTKAQLKKLKERLPTSHKITKTDLAKYINAWERKPHLVALGSQKNFVMFMEDIKRAEVSDNFVPDVQWYKDTISKSIIFKAVDKIVAPFKVSSKINVTTYLVALLSERYHSGFDLNMVWQLQDISDQLKVVVRHWAPEINNALLSSSGGKLISEWAKKAECWEFIKSTPCSVSSSLFPEVKTEVKKKNSK